MINRYWGGGGGGGGGTPKCIIYNFPLMIAFLTMQNIHIYCISRAGSSNVNVLATPEYDDKNLCDLVRHIWDPPKVDQLYTLETFLDSNGFHRNAPGESLLNLMSPITKAISSAHLVVN